MVNTHSLIYCMLSLHVPNTPGDWKEQESAAAPAPSTDEPHWQQGSLDGPRCIVGEFLQKLGLL